VAGSEVTGLSLFAPIRVIAIRGWHPTCGVQTDIAKMLADGGLGRRPAAATGLEARPRRAPETRRQPWGTSGGHGRAEDAEGGPRTEAVGRHWRDKPSRPC
jgi:hypothetical protein